MQQQTISPTQYYLWTKKFRHHAEFIRKFLFGDTAATLPVEFPSHFEAVTEVAEICVPVLLLED